MWILNIENVNWIEAGIFMGALCTYSEDHTGVCEGSGYKAHKDRFFWADQRSRDGYHAHVGDVASLNTTYHDQIWSEGNDDWGAKVGSLSGTSTSNSLGADYIAAGTEEAGTQYHAYACSEQYNLKWEDSNHYWHSGWSDGGNEATLEQDNPPRAWWVNKDHWVRSRANDPSCYGL